MLHVLKQRDLSHSCRWNPFRFALKKFGHEKKMSVGSGEKIFRHFFQCQFFASISQFHFLTRLADEHRSKAESCGATIVLIKSRKPLT